MTNHFRLTAAGHEYLDSDRLEKKTASKYRANLRKVPLAVYVVDVLQHLYTTRRNAYATSYIQLLSTEQKKRQKQIVHG
jgi:hypothetical protein